ncbi:hypothetical protein FA15DRAFT_734534 [Coprinopsis marcescibilis]|uniref:Uncharacterized protein n=1 Tax=Coprinopsis marcescibilis TaxID=230819 RepID=A0A5C3KBR9_COPMA|nr:hypothetical protein FA15DRAFT_734534 [Coprinopsis marcescibilis]
MVVETSVLEEEELQFSFGMDIVKQYLTQQDTVADSRYVETSILKELEIQLLGPMATSAMQPPAPANQDDNNMYVTEAKQVHINARATAMLKLQATHDTLSNLVVQYIQLSLNQVEAASKINEYLSEAIQDRLINCSWSSVSDVSLTSSSAQDMDSDLQWMVQQAEQMKEIMRAGW